MPLPIINLKSLRNMPKKTSTDKAALAVLLGDRPIAYYPSIAKAVGDVTSAVLLSQLLYWQGRQADPDGWIFKTQAELTEETGLSRKNQETARKILVKHRLIEEVRRGIPAKMHFRCDLGAISSILANTSSMPDPCKLECPDRANKDARIGHTITENTTENTTEKEFLLEKETKPLPLSAGMDFSDVEAPGEHGEEPTPSSAPPPPNDEVPPGLTRMPQDESDGVDGYGSIPLEEIVAQRGSMAVMPERAKRESPVVDYIVKAWESSGFAEGVLKVALEHIRKYPVNARQWDKLMDNKLVNSYDEKYTMKIALKIAERMGSRLTGRAKTVSGPWAKAWREIYNEIEDPPSPFFRFMHEEQRGSEKFRKTWESWVKHKADQQESYGSVAAKSALSRLMELPIEKQVACIELSIANTWKSFQIEKFKSPNKTISDYENRQRTGSRNPDRWHGTHIDL